MASDGTYTAIQDWMLDLGLDVWETIAYAVIFGFSQDGESTFTGSLAYLSRKMMCSRGKAISALKRMADLGLVQKIENTRNGVRFCEYRAYTANTGGTPDVLGSTPRVPGGSTPGVPNNIVYETKNKTKEDKISNIRFTPPTFEEVRAYCLERGNAIDPAQFIDYYTANGWKVGRNPMRDWRAAVRQWEARRKTETPYPQSPSPRGKESVYEKNARAFEEFQRRIKLQYADEQ